MTDRLRWCRVRIKDARNGMVTRRARDAHPRSKKDAGQDDENSSDSGGDSFPFRLVLVRHDRLSFPRSAPSHASAGQSRLFEILRVLARLPHLQRATDSIPAGAHCPPIDVLLALSFSFLNWRRFQQVRRLRNWAWSKATVMGLTVLSKPRLSRYSFL